MKPLPMIPASRTDDTARPPATALALDHTHRETILQSHDRCASIGLSRLQRPDFAPLSLAELAAVRERNRRLHTHAAPVMEILYEQVANTHSMVLLTDACGTIIHSIGDDDFLARASKVALQPGVDWSEQAKGTNAIGTALIAERATLVYADEHFIQANQFLTCSAVPILDPRGDVLGVIDVTGDHRGHHHHTMGLVKMSARMIENHWLGDDFRNTMRLHLHSRPEFIGTLMQGILAVSREGRIVGANRSALDHLGMSSAAARMHSVTSLFGTSMGSLVDHFRGALAAPLALWLPNGTQVHVRASVHGAIGFDSMARGHASIDDAGPSQRTPAAIDAQLRKARAPTGLRALETSDPHLRAVLNKVRKVINRNVPTLILGETGTGKELLARAIHDDSERAAQPFVAVNCASIPESLIEAELFGYEDGAFTGARRKGAVGKIVHAHGGTLFLDEIGDMPLALQARLLRVLQERQVMPLGSNKSIPVDVAIVSATHRDLRAMIAAHAFREDLYYRLNHLVVKLPPLRERSDLPLLVQRILDDTDSKPAPQVSAALMKRFAAYRWPGNVRQLTNVLQTAAVMASGERYITCEHLSDDFLEDTRECAEEAVVATPAAHAATPVASAEAAPEAAARTLEQAEIDMIQQALEAEGGNISAASKRLGIARNTIYRRLRWKAAQGAGE
jgi:sigma-54 dependent transcriptional regulator, acetoin dehydrogenase operon transcriptional activator AcoR